MEKSTYIQVCTESSVLETDSHLYFLINVYFLAASGVNVIRGGSEHAVVGCVVLSQHRWSLAAGLAAGVCHVPRHLCRRCRFPTHLLHHHHRPLHFPGWFLLSTLTALSVTQVWQHLFSGSTSILMYHDRSYGIIIGLETILIHCRCLR